VHISQYMKCYFQLMAKVTDYHSEEQTDQPSAKDGHHCGL
jgi:hypothetical protein